MQKIFMTNPLNNWEQEFEKRFSDFPTSAIWFAPVREFIISTLQASGEQEQQRILKLIVTDYTQSGYGDLIPLNWEGFKKEILNQPNNNGNN